MCLEAYQGLHLSLRAKPVAVVRATRKTFPQAWLQNPDLRKVRKALYREMLRYHRAAQRLAWEYHFDMRERGGRAIIRKLPFKTMPSSPQFSGRG
jgi:hypothetical protein